MFRLILFVGGLIFVIKIIIIIIMQAVSMRLAQEYIEAFGQLAKKSTTVIIISFYL